jgi:hypothetical protein
MWVGDEFFPLDLAFDPEHGSVEELLALCPGAPPDVLLLYWPDQDPIPAGLERSPVPVAGVFSDYNLTLQGLSGLWPFFDQVLCDSRGVAVLGPWPFRRVDPWCQYSFRTRVHRLYPELPERDLDVTFVGNLNPVVQPERCAYLRRLAALGDRIRVCIEQGPDGESYGRLLARSRIGFNRSIRGEMNLRAFEVPACGALLLMERENTEVARFLEPGRECVLYGEHDLEPTIFWLLEHEDERAAIAARGHARVQEHRYAQRLAELRVILERAADSRRPAAGSGAGRPRSSAFERSLFRGTSMLTTWARGNGTLRELVEAARLAPSDPRPHNAIACALARRGEALTAALRELSLAAALDPGFVPAQLNLAFLLQGAQRSDLAVPVLARVVAGGGETSHDGPLLPVGFTEEAVSVARARMEAAERRDPRALRDAFVRVAERRLEAIRVPQEVHHVADVAAI